MTSGFLVLIHIRDFRDIVWILKFPDFWGKILLILSHSQSCHLQNQNALSLKNYNVHESRHIGHLYKDSNL